MNYAKTKQYISRNSEIQRILLLGLGFIIAIIVGYGVADSPNATAYGLTMLTTSSPMPTPVPAQLNNSDPKQGAAAAVVHVTIYGENLPNSGQLYLRYSGNQKTRTAEIDTALIPIRTNFIDSTKLVARIPAKVAESPLQPGYYDFVLVYNGGQTTMVKAYHVLDPEDVNDLYAEAYHLNTTPSQLWAGKETKLTLRVHRLGGQGGTGPFQIDFYLTSIAPENRIGSAFVPGISPGGSASSSLVTWTPQGYGDVRIIGVIDAAQNVAESNEDNNVVVVERKITMPLTEDTYPPVISNLQVNTGVKEVNQQQIELSATVQDNADPDNPDAFVSGPSRIYYVELHWYSGIGGGSWIPVNWTSWLGYENAPYAFDLHPTPGLRYLQAWGADGVGNVSNQPDSRRLNYIPEEDEISAGEIRVYRQEANDNQCLNVQLSPSQADEDADLYVWGPEGTLQGFSINGAGINDTVIIQPTDAGTYQIEVEGFTNAHYRLTINLQAECSVAAVESRAISNKTPRQTPAIPVNDSPNINEAPLPQPQIIQSLIFSPWITVDTADLQTQDKLFLPMLQAD